MRKFIREWGIVFAIVVLIGIMVLPAMAADGQGRAKVAADDNGIKLSYDTLTAISNSGVLEKKNGITSDIIIAFTNSSSAVVDIWIQHAQAQVADGGVFSNAASSAIIFNAADSDTYVSASTLRLLPFVRIHTEDSDITSNNVGVNLWAW